MPLVTCRYRVLFDDLNATSEADALAHALVRAPACVQNALESVEGFQNGASRSNDDHGGWLMLPRRRVLGTC